MNRRRMMAMIGSLLLVAGILNIAGGILHGNPVKLLIGVGFVIIGFLYLIHGKQAK